ncbi:MAG TPA: response regulator [Stellaceae bacterium]|nr:response regulator [Stellaceae bacterium]
MIYVVDDDDDVREALRRLLEWEGFDVSAFASCADVLRHGLSDDPACLVLDVHMPGMTGLELLERIRRDRRTMPAVLMTGRPDAAILRAAARAGVALLRKPFAADELVNSIEEALRPQAETRIGPAP